MNFTELFEAAIKIKAMRPTSLTQKLWAIAYGLLLLGSDRVENDISLRFRKAGRVWCGGAQETH